MNISDREGLVRDLRDCRQSITIRKELFAQLLNRNDATFEDARAIAEPLLLEATLSESTLAARLSVDPGFMELRESMIRELAHWKQLDGQELDAFLTEVYHRVPILRQSIVNGIACGEDGRIERFLTRIFGDPPELTAESVVLISELAERNPKRIEYVEKCFQRANNPKAKDSLAISLARAGNTIGIEFLERKVSECTFAPYEKLLAAGDWVTGMRIIERCTDIYVLKNAGSELGRNEFDRMMGSRPVYSLECDLLEGLMKVDRRNATRVDSAS